MPLEWPGTVPLSSIDVRKFAKTILSFKLGESGKPASGDFPSSISCRCVQLPIPQEAGFQNRKVVQDGRLMRTLVSAFMLFALVVDVQAQSVQGMPADRRAGTVVSDECPLDLPT